MSCADAARNQALNLECGTQTNQEQTQKVGFTDLVTVHSTNENSGALAGATGADQHSTNFVSIEYRKRAEAATSLSLSIGNCDPQDACIIMEAALLRLGAGSPIPPLLGIMDAATDWAEWASPAERKAYALACYNRLPPADRAAFLAYVGRGAA